MQQTLKQIKTVNQFKENTGPPIAVTHSRETCPRNFHRTEEITALFVPYANRDDTIVDKRKIVRKACECKLMIGGLFLS